MIMGTRAVWLRRIRWYGFAKTVILSDIGTEQVSVSEQLSIHERDDTYPLTTGRKERPSGPFAHACITPAGTFRKQSRRTGPGDWLHPTAFAIPSNEAKLGVVDMEFAAPDSIIAARKGGFIP